MGRADGRDIEKVGSGVERRVQQQTLPLNSRRLTALVLRQLVGGLGVPMNASQAD